MNYNITGRTRLTGLLGSPVSHSISPLMHNEAFRLLKLDYAYLCFDTKTAGLSEVVKGLQALDARGWNCTMPDKQAMCELADVLSPAAQMIGAVNTVVNENGLLLGHNTDGIGYMQAVKHAGYDLCNKSMTLLGAGGAATAIAVQAALDGVAAIHLFTRRGRSFAHAENLAEQINANTSCRISLFDIDDKISLARCLEQDALLTNATSVGMAPNVNDSIISEAAMLPPTLIVSDIIYHPRETKLMSLAKAAGCPTFNGLYMLLYQGAEAFRLWTGEAMPVDAVKELIYS